MMDLNRIEADIEIVKAFGEANAGQRIRAKDISIDTLRAIKNVRATARRYESPIPFEFSGVASDGFWFFGIEGSYRYWYPHLKATIAILLQKPWKR